ncbi:MAG: hypothetical protein ACOYOB_21475, partial [Myxococcota bacterium]
DVLVSGCHMLSALLKSNRDNQVVMTFTPNEPSDCHPQIGCAGLESTGAVACPSLGRAAVCLQDDNRNGCPDAREGDGTCDELEADGTAGLCPVGADETDCGDGT